MTDFISHYYIKVHAYVAFDHMRITGFHMYTMFVCLKTSHDDELIKVVFTHPKQALLWTLAFHSISFTIHLCWVIPFCLEQICSCLQLLYSFLANQNHLENHKNKNKQQVWLLFLLPCSRLCCLFQIRNTWSNPASLSEVDVTKCCLRKLRFVKFTKLLIWNMLVFIIFWLNTDYFPFQFPVILLFGLLGNPPARICGWRTKFPPSPSSFPQNRKTERRYIRELPWRQSLFLDNSEHRRANLRLTLVNSEQSHKQMPL